jgi:hypothetical protein
MHGRADLRTVFHEPLFLWDFSVAFKTAKRSKSINTEFLQLQRQKLRDHDAKQKAKQEEKAAQQQQTHAARTQPSARPPKPEAGSSMPLPTVKPTPKEVPTPNVAPMEPVPNAMVGGKSSKPNPKAKPIMASKLDKPPKETAHSDP